MTLATPPTLLPLRDYQERARDAFLAGVEAGTTRQMIVLPTGAGKTLLATHLVNELARPRHWRTVFVVHRDELVKQSVRALASIDPTLSVGIVKAEQSETHAPIIVASAQTLAQRKRLDRLRIALAEAPGVFWIEDEAHHSIAPTRMRAIEEVAPDVLLGLTATPERGDGGALGNLFQQITYQVGMLELMARGRLARLVGVRIGTDVSLDTVRTTAGELNEGDLEDAIDTPRRNRLIVDGWQRHAADRTRTVVFCVTVAHAIHVAEAFQAAGIDTAAVFGEASYRFPAGRSTRIESEREPIYEAFHEGRIRVLVNVMVCTEGWDEPAIDAIVMARPTKSRGLFVQCVGRGARTAQGKANCIAEGQRVLTDHGLVPIEHVTTAMRVWDGVAFVSHAGAACKGVQDVIEYAGLIATPDHNVQTTTGWRTFGDCAATATPIVVTGDGGTAIREAAGYRRRTPDEPWARVPAGAMYDMRGRGMARAADAQGRPGGLSVLRESAVSAEVVSQSGYRGQAALHESEQQFLSTLWGQGDRVSLSLSNSNGDVGSGAFGTASGYGVGPDQQRRTLRTRQSALCNTGSEHRQLAQATCERGVSHVQDRVPGSALCRFDTPRFAVEGDDLRADRRTVQPAVRQTQRRVWDILNAGPRHRFTVEGLLVSNCIVLDMVDISSRHKLVGMASLTTDKASLTTADDDADTWQPAEDEPFDLLEQAAELDARRRERAEKQARLNLEADAGRARLASETKAVNLYAASPWLWQESKGIHYAPAGDGAWLVIKGEPDGFRPYLLRSDRTTRDAQLSPLFDRSLDFEMAMGLAHDRAPQLPARERRLYDRAATWRTQTAPPSEAQIAAAARWRIPLTGKETKADVSRLMDEAVFHAAHWRATRGRNR